MSTPLPILLARLANTLETARLRSAADFVSPLPTIEQAQRELEQIRDLVT